MAKDKALKEAEQSIKDLMHALAEDRVVYDEYRPEELEALATLDAIKEALAQPTQEPVAYYHPHKGFYWAKPTHIVAPTVVDVPPVPLYVKWKAAQRPWVGLTDEEIEKWTPEIHGVIRSIEQALKEKNT